MDLSAIFLSTFLLVFIGELGDKTQIASGTGALANQKYAKVIFSSSALALLSVAGLTVFFAGLIPSNYLPKIIQAGGVMLIGYGLWLYQQANKFNLNEDEETTKTSGWVLFLSHFSVVFVAELGDKTQVATLAASIENQSYLLLVFLSSGSALVTVTAITVWGVTKIPVEWVKKIQQIGAILMSIYGVYMLIS